MSDLQPLLVTSFSKILGKGLELLTPYKQNNRAEKDLGGLLILAQAGDKECALPTNYALPFSEANKAFPQEKKNTFKSGFPFLLINQWKGMPL